jgi:glucose/arabinose dehydrogenase
MHRAWLAFVVVAAGSVAPSQAASTRELVLFTVGIRGVPGEQFVVASDDAELVTRCREELARPVEDRDLFPVGAVVAGHGGFNTDWTWHLDPDAWDLTEAAIELCDGRPSYLEEHLESWLDEVGSYCPWGGYLVREGVVGPVADPSRLEVTLEPTSIGGFARPTSIVSAGDGSGRLFVVEQPGTVRVVRDGVLLAAPFLDLADRVNDAGNEQGLLGLAFHPEYATTGWLYVNYTDAAGDTVVSRFAVRSDDPDCADPASEVVLLEVEQPFANHNGGHLAFRPDGTLLVALGDGGSGGDPLGNAQDPQSLLGKLLRFGIAEDGGLEVPNDNPFVDDPQVRDEIWALGLRNPWQFTVDRATGDLVIGDVGQRDWEEVDVEGARSPGGVNWGWNVMEGFHCFDSGTCDTDGLVLPAAEYSHDEGCSVTGGVVYRGDRYPFLRGTYLFMDFCSGRLWALQAGGPHGWAVAQVGTLPSGVTTFGEDEGGELWVIPGSRVLYRITARELSPAPRRAGARLSRP